MPDELLNADKQKSESLVQALKSLENLKYPDTGERIFSSKCISQIKDIECAPIYCSANESLLLMKHDRDDCKNIGAVLIAACFFIKIFI